jgi:hypothetical protein
MKTSISVTKMFNLVNQNVLIELNFVYPFFNDKSNGQLTLFKNFLLEIRLRELLR